MLGGVVFVAYLATATFHDPLNNDTRAASFGAWQFAVHGNATLTPFAKEASWLFHSGNRYVTNRFPGVIFWATPFYVVFGNRSFPTVYPGALAAAAAAALAVSMMFSLSTSLVDRRRALISALVFAFGTGTWTVSADQLWSHGPAQVAVLLTVILARRDRWLLAGLPAGFAILVRPHLGVVAVVIGLFAAARVRRLRPLLISVGCLVGVAILVVYNHDLWGRYSVFGSYTNLNDAPNHRISGFLFGVAGSLVSPERGMLVMTPVLVTLLPGVRVGWRQAPPWVRSAALAGLAYLAVQLWVSRFSGGDGFYSYRTTLEGLTLCTPLLVVAWREWTSATRFRRMACATLAAASVGLHAFGAVMHWVPSGKHSPWTTYLPYELARHVGVAITGGWIVLLVMSAAIAGRFAWTRPALSAAPVLS